MDKLGESSLESWSGNSVHTLRSQHSKRSNRSNRSAASSRNASKPGSNTSVNNGPADEQNLMVLPHAKSKKKGHEKRKSDTVDIDQKILHKHSYERRGTVIPRRD